MKCVTYLDSEQQYTEINSRNGRSAVNRVLINFSLISGKLRSEDSDNEYDDGHSERVFYANIVTY